MSFFFQISDNPSNRNIETNYEDTNEQNNVKRYNVRENRIVIENRSEWTPPGSVRRRAASKEAYYAAKEKRNPLLEKVKNTRLTCFKSQNFNPSLYAFPMTPSCYDDNDTDVPESPSKSRSKSEWNLTDTSDSSNVSVNDTDGKIDNSGISSKLRAISDKYLKSSTNKLLAKLYKSSDKPQSEKEKKLRSFSYGTLPGLNEFQTFHDICEQKESSFDCSLNDSVSNIVNDENSSEDCDSGILVSSNSSVVDSCAGRKGACHFRSASQDTPTFDDEKLELTERQKRRQRQVDVDEPPTPQLPPKNSPFLSNLSRNYNVITLTRDHVEEEVGVIVKKVKTIQSREAFVVYDIVPGGLAAR